jgi:dsRNA-specific ribonuclease
MISEHLFHNFPGYEGRPSTMASIIVSAKTLSEKARTGAGAHHPRSRPHGETAASRSILCNAFEAVVAALYLDGARRSRRFSSSATSG